MNPELETILNSIAREIAFELTVWRLRLKDVHITIVDCVNRGDLLGMAMASVEHAGLLDQVINIMTNRLGPVPNLIKVIDPTLLDQVLSDPAFQRFMISTIEAVKSSKPATPERPLSDEERHGLQLMPDQVFDAARNIHAQACTRPDCELHRAFEAEVRRRQTLR